MVKCTESQKGLVNINKMWKMIGNRLVSDKLPTMLLSAY